MLKSPEDRGSSRFRKCSSSVAPVTRISQTVYGIPRMVYPLPTEKGP